MRSSAGTYAQLFWSDAPSFTEQHSARLPLKSAGSFQRLYFPLPADGASWLRFDPMDAPGEAVITEIRLLDSGGKLLASIGLENLRPAIQIASITRDGDAARIQTMPGGTDPALYLPIGCIDRGSGWRRLTMVTTAGAALVSAAILGLLVACVVVIGRAAFASHPGEEATALSRRRRRLSALWLAALFLVVFTAKLQFLHQHPVKVPFWDQWDAEAGAVLIPFSECGLSWRAMFRPHNEHRIFFTRLLALDLVLANGQWDPRLQQVVNAAMHSGIAVLVATMFWLAGNRRRLDLIVFVCALTFALPFAWENTLFGFQSPFYFLVLFSVLGLWLTTRHAPVSPGWCLGWVCAASALFTAASGVLVPVAILSIVALTLANEPRAWRASVANVAAAAATLGFGAAFAPPSMVQPQHAPLKAHSLMEFAIALGRGLAWPWIDHPALVPLMWLPLGILLLRAGLRRGKTIPFERLAVGLGVWVALHAAALAYGRGAGGAAPATRYMDFLSLGVVANAMALLAMPDWGWTRPIARQLTWVPLAAWLAFSGGGILRLADRTIVELDPWNGYFAAHVANIHRLIVSGDMAGFVSKPPLIELPYPGAQRLADFLQEPYIRRILPASVRAPLRVEAQAVTGNAFVPEGFYAIIPRDPLQRSWGSLSVAGNPAKGRFESQPLTCGAGFLKFELAGYVGQANQRLALKDLSSARERGISASHLPRERWMDAFVRCPDGPFAIVAVDEDPATWFAFREPVEMGPGSLLAETLIENSSALLAAALLLAFVVARSTGTSLDFPVLSMQSPIAPPRG
jgi:hypothetical protein